MKFRSAGVLITFLFAVLQTTNAFSWPFSSSSSSDSLIESWDINDLKDYLSDNSISFNRKKSTIEELKQLTKDTWGQKQAELKAMEKKLTTEGDNYNTFSHWGVGNGFWADGLSGITQKVLGRPKSRVAQGYDNVVNSYSDIQSWIFNTWSENDLKKLLKKAGIKYDEAKYTSRSQLAKLAGDSYYQIAKSADASGKYAGDWLYSSWDNKALKKWLKDHDVDYSSLKDNRETLLRKVRENIYGASQYAADQRDSVLEQLDLTGKEIFDKFGGIRDDFFNSWSPNQLYSWLKAHKIEVEDSIKDNKEELSLVAQKNKNELKEDINSWSNAASKSVSPYLSKVTSSVDNLINDTFFVGIEGWNRDRLKSFLDSRNVPVPHFATKWQLIQLVKQNKYKPITNFKNEDFFKGWSKENVQKWLNEQTDSAANTGKDIADKSEDYYKQFLANLGFYASKIHSGASEYVDTATSAVVEKVNGIKPKKTVKDQFFDYWSDTDLNYYLLSFGIRPRQPTTREQLINLAKTNTRWYVSGATYDAKNRFADLQAGGSSYLNWIAYQLNNFRDWVYYKVYKRYI